MEAPRPLAAVLAATAVAVRKIALLCAVVGLAALVAAPTLAGEPDEAPSAEDESPGGPDDTEASGGLLFDSERLREAQAAVEQAEVSLAAAQRSAATASAALPDLDLAIERINAAVPVLREQALRADHDARRASEHLSSLLVHRYIEHDPLSSGLAALEHPDLAVRYERTSTVFSAAERERADTAESARQRLATATAQLQTARDTIDLVQAERARIGRQETVALAMVAATEEELPELAAIVEEERRLGSLDATDLTVTVLEAYVRAADAANLADPECGVRWQILAAIGRVETRHGTYAGSAVDERGNTTKEIIGIALNGTRNTAVIRDTDGGLLDGDTEFDRAVGPMQFIPSTWARYAADGNGDGLEDPHNIFDAAAAAGAYLCRAGEFADVASSRSAIHAYNRSDAYVDAVLSIAEEYDTIVVRARS